MAILSSRVKIVCAIVCTFYLNGHGYKQRVVGGSLCIRIPMAVMEKAMVFGWSHCVFNGVVN